MPGSTYTVLGDRELPTSPTDDETGLPISFYIYADLENDSRNLKVEPIYQDYIVSGSTIKSTYHIIKKGNFLFFTSLLYFLTPVSIACFIFEYCFTNLG